MKTEVSNSSKLTSRIVKTGLFGALWFGLIYYGLLFVFGVKYLNPEYYGSYFYAWRLNFADKIMTHGRYKLIKKNEHPNTPDREEFYKIAQEGPAYLIRFDRPEHYPREFDQQFSLMFPAYENFLKLRQNYIVETEGLKSELDVSVGDLTKKAKTKGEAKPMYFADAKGKSVDEMMEILFPNSNEDNNPWFEMSGILIDVISNILDSKPGYLFDGKVVGNRLMDDIRKGLKALELEDKVSDRDINDFFIRNGRVSGTAQERFAYSRLYYLFYFLTAGVEFKSDSLAKIESSAADQKSLQEFYEARMMYVANIFARIFSSIYPNGNSKDVSKIGVWEKFRNYYSPSRAPKSDSVEQSDIDLIKTSFQSRT